MAKSCAIIPAVRYTPSGATKEVVEDSLLFKDLQSKFPKNRKKQIRLYNIAVNPQFKEFVEQNYPEYFGMGQGYTEQGEINLTTLLKLVGEKDVVYDADFIEKLIANKEEFAANEFDMNEEGFSAGINAVARFNRQSAYRQSYKAQLVEDGGKYKIRLVKWGMLKRDDKTRFATKLIHFTRREDVKYKITRIMAEAGINVKYVDDTLKENFGEKDPNNEDISALEAGYRAYMGVMRGSDSEHFYLRAGFYALLSNSKSSEVMDRCLDILSRPENEAFVEAKLAEIGEKDKEVYRQVANEPGYEGTRSRQEIVLAYMIGESLVKHESDMGAGIPIVGSFLRLLKILVRECKLVFAKLESVKRRMGPEKVAELLISKQADQVAKAFYGGEHGNIMESVQENIMSIVNSQLSMTSKAATKSRKRIKSVLQEMKTSGANWRMVMGLDEVLAGAEEIFDNKKDRTQETEMRKAILDTIENVLTFLQDPKEGLCGDQLRQDIENTRRYGESMQQYGEKIRGAKQILGMLMEIMKIMDYEKEIIQGTADEGLKKKYIELTNSVASLNNRVNISGETITARFLSEVIGADYVSVTLGKKFWGRQQELKDLGLEMSNEDAFRIGVNKVVIPVRVLLNQSKDIDFLTKTIVSMGRVQDLTLQMIDMYNRKRQGEVRAKTIEIERRLSSIYKRARARGIDLSDWYERAYDSDKNRWNESRSDFNMLTGNFITMVDFESYERDVARFKEQCWEEFKARNPELNTEDNGRFSLTNRYLWEKEWEKRLAAWNIGKEDGIARATLVDMPWGKDRIKKEWVPLTELDAKSNPGVKMKTYTNYRFQDYFGKDADERAHDDTKRERFELYTELMSLKRELDGECLEAGSTKWYRAPQFRGRYFNELMNRRNALGMADAGMHHMLGRFVEDSDMADYGDDRYHDIGAGEFDPFMTQAQLDRHRMDRLPMYGINKLRDMSQLSTKPHESMRAYAYMAENYRATRDVISTLELYHDIVSNKSGGNRTIATRKAEKLDQYFRNNFYGTGIKLERYKGKVLSEIVNGATRKIDIKYGTGLRERIHVEPTVYILTEFVKTINNFTTFWMLGGNVGSAGINFVSGVVRLATEAKKGEQFNRWELLTSTLIYLLYGAQNILWENPKAFFATRGGMPGAVMKPNKLSLFVKMCDPKNDYQQDVSSTRGRTVAGRIRDVGMCLYSWSDSYMSTVGYIAEALHTKLIDEKGMRGDGRRNYNLWNCLTLSKDANGEPMLDFGGRKYFTSTRKLRRYKLVGEIEAELNDRIGRVSGRSLDEQMKRVDKRELLRLLNEKLANEERKIESPTLPRTEQEGAKEMADDLRAIYLYLDLKGIVKVEKQKEGYFDENQSFSVRSMMRTLTEYEENQKYGHRDFEELQYQGRMLNVYMHGVYNSTDRGTMQNALLGSMMSTLKGYAFGYYMRELIGSRVDVGNGKRLTVEEYMEKYYPSVLNDPYFGHDAKLVTSVVTGSVDEINKLLSDKDMHDIYNVGILDTDITEGTIITLLKSITNPLRVKGLFMSAIATIGGTIPGIGHDIAQAYIGDDGKNAWGSRSQRANLVREWGNLLLLMVMQMIRTLVGAALPPAEEGDEEYTERLDKLIQDLAKKAEAGTLNEEEKKRWAALNNVDLSGMDDSEAKSALRKALGKFEPQHEAKPTLLGAMYYWLAGSELENRGWSPFFPGYMLSEMQNILSLALPQLNALLQMYDNIDVTAESLNANDLMGMVGEDLEANKDDLSKFEFIKKVRLEHEIGAKLLTEYIEKHKDGRMPLPDLNSDEFFDVEIDGHNMKTLPEEWKKKVRNAAYGFMKESFGTDKNIYKKGNDGAYIFNFENENLKKVLSLPTKLSQWGAEQITSGNEEFNEKVKAQNSDDPLLYSDSKYLINKYYYGSSGHAHEKYDLKYEKDWEKVTPFVRFMHMAADPIGAIRNRVYFLRGRR